ncbi:MAG: hypothetical protein KY468_19925 [Armatimonadetes bacterium]|nr:hypothetical protein [Armatimonadota bacterium]
MLKPPLSPDRNGSSGARLRASKIRPWIGPGLVLALIASFVLWRKMPSEPSGPPRVIPTQRAGDPASPPGAPDPSWLVKQKETLQLAPPQMERLRRLERRWDRETRALREALTQESARVDRALSQGDGQRVTLQQIQELAGPASDLSRQLSDARRAWWEEAGEALSPAQRKEAERLWSTRLQRKAGERKGNE